MVEIDPNSLKREAVRLRKLAREIVDEDGKRALIVLAEEYDARAAEAEASGSGSVLPPD